MVTYDPPIIGPLTMRREGYMWRVGKERGPRVADGGTVVVQMR